MKTATHWMASELSNDLNEWPTDPVTSPEIAAELMVRLPPSGFLGSARVWRDLRNLGYASVTVQGWDKIDTPADGECVRALDGGWFRKSQCSRSVMVGLSFDAREPVEA